MIEDKNLLVIKKIAQEHLPDSKVMLFGSRARGIYREDSDYDVLVIIQYKMSPDEKFSTRVSIRRELVKNDIFCDLLIQSEEEVKIKKTLIDHVIRYAMEEAIVI